MFQRGWKFTYDNMAINYNPQIVTDGLVLCLDAANKDSHSGIGTIWYDISGNANHVTLTNGAAYNSSNNGNVSFDGSNDYADFYAPNLGTIATVEMWCKIGSTFTDKMFFGWNVYDVWCQGKAIGFNTANSDLYGISSTTVTSLGLENNWKHYIFEMRTDVSYSNNKIYINGSLQSLSQISATENASNRSFNSGNGRIAVWKYDFNYCIPMNCAVFKVYNRSLSFTEILQNYNATRGRFL